MEDMAEDMAEDMVSSKNFTIKSIQLLFLYYLKGGYGGYGKMV